MNGLSLLVDPVLGAAGSMTPIDNSPNPRRNPLVELPVSTGEAISTDACLITHLHRDHFDSAAGEFLPKHMAVFCQPEDRDKLQEQGFNNIQAVNPAVTWQGITITRTGGQHGTGEIGRKMAPVSGYILKSEGEPVLYIAGDTIWCPEVAAALAEHKPQVIVLNGGAARFNEGEPITMGTQDIYQVCRQAPAAIIIVVHLEAINHCLLTRAELKGFLVQHGLESRVMVPDDGQWLMC